MIMMLTKESAAWALARVETVLSKLSRGITPVDESDLLSLHYVTQFLYACKRKMPKEKKVRESPIPHVRRATLVGGEEREGQRCLKTSEKKWSAALSAERNFD
jgi:hypothetical protein